MAAASYIIQLINVTECMHRSIRHLSYPPTYFFSPKREGDISCESFHVSREVICHPRCIPFTLLDRFNLTDREGSADRKVPIQPLVFYSKDGKVSRYNLRKVRNPFPKLRDVRVENNDNRIM